MKTKNSDYSRAKKVNKAYLYSGAKLTIKNIMSLKKAMSFFKGY